MNLKKILVIAGVALLAYFLIMQPTSVAGIVNSILNTLKDAAESLITFVQTVFAG